MHPGQICLRVDLGATAVDATAALTHVEVCLPGVGVLLELPGPPTAAPTAAAVFVLPDKRRFAIFRQPVGLVGGGNAT